MKNWWRDPVTGKKYDYELGKGCVNKDGSEIKFKKNPSQLTEKQQFEMDVSSKRLYEEVEDPFAKRELIRRFAKWPVSFEHILEYEKQRSWLHRKGLISESRVFKRAKKHYDRMIIKIANYK